MSDGGKFIISNSAFMAAVRRAYDALVSAESVAHACLKDGGDGLMDAYLTIGAGRYACREFLCMDLSGKSVEVLGPVPERTAFAPNYQPESAHAGDLQKAIHELKDAEMVSRVLDLAVIHRENDDEATVSGLSRHIAEAATALQQRLDALIETELGVQTSRCAV